MIEQCPICSKYGYIPVWAVERSPLLLLIQNETEIVPEHFTKLDVVRCRGCAHLFNRAYDLADWETTYRTDTLTNKPVHISMSGYLESVSEWIGRDSISGKHLIEVGAGSGYLARMLAQYADSVTVFEPSLGLKPEMLPGKNIKLINEPFTSGSVTKTADLIICRQVMEHVADPLSFLSEMRKSLSSDGLIYLEVPCAEYIEENAAFFEFHNAHVQYFHRPNLLSLAAQAGLKPVKERSIKAGMISACFCARLKAVIL